MTDMVPSPGHGGSGSEINDDGHESINNSGGLFRSRSLVPEVFDRETMNAVLKEWKTSMKDLPLDLQQACMTGALSSANLTRFLCLNAQSSFVRLLARLIPSHVYTDFTSKIMADPSLPYKLCLEALFSLGYSVWMDTRGSSALSIKRSKVILAQITTIFMSNSILNHVYLD
ncbi:hypothetical protein TorRG33x02_253760 [Trema orientale]|uniref:Uncharacterized protein n=1 Tax=Trema orientale TaxID=63057 RepID=A0A2P5DEA0_TREOI|nr:hypothetical protein TorRG33x02_253760 [Trema orientale]